MSASLIVSIHDVAPATIVESQHWLRMAEDRGFRVVLLVIPGHWRGRTMNEEPDFADWLHQVTARGHEVALHGWEHVGAIDDTSPGSMWERARARVRARGCAEFASLGASEARRRIGLGLSVLRAHDLDPVGFVPPGWLARPSTADVLADLGFRYTLTQWRVLDLSRRTSPIVPSTSQRPGSVVTGASARVNGVWVQGWAAMRRPLRIALHPDDLADDRLVTATERMFSHASKQRYEGITYSEFVDRGDASRRAGGE